MQPHESALEGPATYRLPADSLEGSGILKAHRGKGGSLPTYILVNSQIMNGVCRMQANYGEAGGLGGRNLAIQGVPCQCCGSFKHKAGKCQLLSIDDISCGQDQERHILKGKKPR